MNTLYIICGSPGAGKSTYGSRLAREKQAVFLDIDTATERLVRLGLHLAGHDPDDRDSPYFKTHFRQPIYDALFDISRDNPHVPVVITGPFTREIREQDWSEKLKDFLQRPVDIHYVYCRPQIRRQRMENRSNARDNGKFENWDDVNAYYGDETPPCFEHVFIDNSY